MPDAFLVHLRRLDLNSLIGDVIDAVAKALLTEFFFDVDAGSLQIKRFARGAGGGLQISAFIGWVASAAARGEKRVASGSGAEGEGLGIAHSASVATINALTPSLSRATGEGAEQKRLWPLTGGINAPRPSSRQRLLPQLAAHATAPHWSCVPATFF